MLSLPPPPNESVHEWRCPGCHAYFWAFSVHALDQEKSTHTCKYSIKSYDKIDWTPGDLAFLKQAVIKAD